MTENHFVKLNWTQIFHSPSMKPLKASLGHELEGCWSVSEKAFIEYPSLLLSQASRFEFDDLLPASHRLWSSSSFLDMFNSLDAKVIK